MEKQIFNINGKDYILHPFMAGQVRRLVRPILEEAGEIQKAGKAIMGRENDPEVLGEMADLTARGQSLMERQGEAALAGLQNTYPGLTQADLEDNLTPVQVTNLFNRLVQVTMDGSNEPGEAMPQTKKRSR